MSKVAKSRMADVLIKAESDIRKSLILCGIPLPIKIQVVANTVHGHKVEYCHDGENFIKVHGAASFEKNKGPLPMLTYFESSVINNGTSDWSMSRSLLIVTYSKGSRKSYFGYPGSGPDTDPRYPLTHRMSLPMPPGFPKLETLTELFPSPI